MSLFTFITHTKELLPELRRIADALDRIAPPVPAEPDISLTPEDAVTYVDETKIAQAEQAEQAGELERWLREHPEWDEAAEPASQGESEER